MPVDARTGPLLSVKQTIPPVRAGMVDRRRLQDRLGTPAKLTLLVAPAGWGKSSLASRWASSAAAETRVAWVSLDPGDDEPVRFWSYVLSALAGVSDQISSAALDALPASTAGPMAQALPLLLNELAATSSQHVLVLDDYHVISHRDVHESLEFLINYLPPTLRIVISSRVDPPFPLARMRVRGELVELRADDLRFSLDESTALVSAVSEADVEALTAAAVWERTEGWAAGLQLAALALRGQVKTSGTADRMLGDDRHLFDYFADEIFPALAPRQRELLVGAAPLELLSGSLCDAALGVDGSAGVLAELEASDLFVVALDREREWFRCHRLLRDALLHTPAVRSGHGAQDVLRRAARWFEEHGRIDDAVRHLLDAGDSENAARLLTTQLMWFFERGWAATYLALGERLPESAVGPPLAVNLAYAADLCGHTDRVMHWLDACDSHLDDDAGLHRWRSGRAGVMALRGVMGTPANDTSAAVTLCERALTLESAGSDVQSPNALAALGRAYGLDGRFDDGARLLADTWARRAEFDWPTERVLQVASYLSLFLLALDRVDELDALLADAGEVADKAEAQWGVAAAAPVVTLIRLVQGRRAYQRSDLAEAAELLEAGQVMAELKSQPTYVVLGLVFRADLLLASGDRRGARASLARASDIVDDDPVTPFVSAWLEQAQNRIGRLASKEAVESGPLFEQLTDRELSILRMLPGSASQREIGAALFLSINTVKAYNKSLYRKLSAGSRADAVRAARDLGLI